MNIVGCGGANGNSDGVEVVDSNFIERGKFEAEGKRVDRARFGRGVEIDSRL